MAEQIFSLSPQGLLDDWEKSIARKDMYLCRTIGVQDNEYNAIKYGLQKVISETDKTIIIHDFGNYQIDGDEFNSPDWYQEKALTKRDRGFGRQVSASLIDSLLREEPFQKQNPHFDVLVIDKDLTTKMNDPENNFIFGYGPYPNNIMSIKRFLHWIQNNRLRYESLAVLAAHEFAHNLDLVGRNFNIGREGYKEGHCNAERGFCLMEQVNVDGARAIWEQAPLLFERENWLCPDCTEEISVKRKILTEKLGSFW